MREMDKLLKIKTSNIPEPIRVLMLRKKGGVCWLQFEDDMLPKLTSKFKEYNLKEFNATEENIIKLSEILLRIGEEMVFYFNEVSDSLDLVSDFEMRIEDF